MTIVVQRTRPLPQWLWRWEVVSVVVGLLYACGVSAMYGDDYRIALALYFVAVFLLALKFATWEEVKFQGQKRRIVAIAMTIVIAVGILWASDAWIDLRRK